MENEIVKMDSKGIIATVNDSVEKIKDIESKIAKSVKAADEAKKSVKSAMDVERHWYQNTTARIVDKLQPAVKDIAHAVEVSVETQKLLFDHEKILANCCKSLFAMGAANIAATRTTVRQIKMQLENASEEEISEMARKELENVVAQLQMQEDLVNRQDKLTEKVKVVNAKMEGISDSLDDQDRRIDSNRERLDEKDEKDVEHDRRLAEKDQKDAEHDRRLNELDAKALTQEKVIANMNIHISNLEKNIADLNTRLNKSKKGLIALAISFVVALAACVARFLISI